MTEEIKKIVEVLRQGGVIIYPTDTVWGIGCDATNAEAVARVYDIKNSADKKGMIVLVDKIDNVGKYFRQVPAIAWDLMEVSDEPLTLILPGAAGVASNLISEEGTLAVRVPNHEFCRGIAKMLGRPLVSTSANISGRPAPACRKDIAPELIAAVDYVADAKFEGKPTGKASSIIMLGQNGEVSIIRE